MKRLLLTFSLLAVLGAGCVPGAQEPGVIYLPDRIEDVQPETLPRALKEARERGKQSVTIEDPDGNIVRADISSQTYTVFSFTLPEDIEDPFAILTEYNVDVSRVYNTRVEDGVQYFNLNVVDTMRLSSYMYEISVRIHELRSTGDWIVQID